MNKQATQNPEVMHRAMSHAEAKPSLSPIRRCTPVPWGAGGEMGPEGGDFRRRDDHNFDPSQSIEAVVRAQQQRQEIKLRNMTSSGVIW